MALPASLNVHPHFNPEEAAHAATEFVSSLDNLPGEVVFLLEEIKEKDIRINQLVQRINTRHMGLTKQAKALASGTLSTSTTSNGTSTPPVPTSTPGSSTTGGGGLPTAHLSHKDAQALTKIQVEWGKVELLQDEKIKLAERMERIVSRARERGRAEWEKVGGIEIEDVNIDQKPGMGMLGELGSGDLVLPPGGLGSGIDGRPQKKRKPNAIPLPPSFSGSGPMIHPPSTSMPPPSAPSNSSRPSLSARSSTHGHSHGHGHGHSRKRHQSIATQSDADGDGEYDPDVEVDADADADADADGGEGTEADDTLYCICQQKSYGEMIGCDNDRCKYEWFHVACVNISGPLPDTWYCPDCVIKLGFASSDGKIAAGGGGGGGGSGNNRKSRKK